MDVEVHIELCRENAVLPEYAKAGDAGMDIYAAEDIIIKPGKTVIVPTGLKLAIPKGYEIQVRPRSGISLNTPLRIVNSPGTIDSGYRNELGIIINNSSNIESNADSCRSEDINIDINIDINEVPTKILTLENKGNRMGTYIIKKGDRIAQIVLQEVPKIKFTVVKSVKNIGEDRGGGFGSTGV